MVPWQTPERQNPERQTPDKTNSWQDKLLKIQTPERQTPEIMKFFSEWNMIKFINFRRKKSANILEKILNL